MKLTESDCRQIEKINGDWIAYQYITIDSLRWLIEDFFPRVSLRPAPEVVWGEWEHLGMQDYELDIKCQSCGRDMYYLTVTSTLSGFDWEVACADDDNTTICTLKKGKRATVAAAQSAAETAAMHLEKGVEGRTQTIGQLK
ncbi:hypothetical protein C4571_02045 [Candidatus Parcubacteria bacterium]|nr:MAG: hypothetical protein C4571_02045 [Candidatus Parcubacteria bacterium]